jgi:hypothetical protein
MNNPGEIQGNLKEIKKPDHLNNPAFVYVENA